MLIARLDQLTQKIDRLRDLTQQAGNAQAFGTRARLLNDPSIRLDGLASIAQELRHRDIAISFDQNQLAALAAFTKQLRLIIDAYHADPQSIVAAEQRYTFWEPLKTLPNQVRDALQQAWSEYVDTMLPVQQLDLLQTLGQLPGFQIHVTQIRQLYGEAERLRGWLPQSTDEIDRVSAIASALKSAWAHLPTEGIPADVRDFLTAAVGGSAKLAQLTNSVVEWLRINNLVDSVRISLRA